MARSCYDHARLMLEGLLYCYLKLLRSQVYLHLYYSTVTVAYRTTVHTALCIQLELPPVFVVASPLQINNSIWERKQSFSMA